MQRLSLPTDATRFAPTSRSLAPALLWLMFSFAWLLHGQGRVSSASIGGWLITSALLIAFAFYVRANRGIWVTESELWTNSVLGPKPVVGACSSPRIESVRIHRGGIFAATLRGYMIVGERSIFISSRHYSQGTVAQIADLIHASSDFSERSMTFEAAAERYEDPFSLFVTRPALVFWGIMALVVAATAVASVL